MGEWARKYVPLTHLTCVQHEQLGGNHDPMEAEYPSKTNGNRISMNFPMEGWFFSFVIDVAALHFSPSLLHVIKNKSCQAEKRLGLPVST